MKACLVLSEAGGRPHPALASAPTPEERRALRRSTARDRSKEGSCRKLTQQALGTMHCADGSVRKGMAPQAGGRGEPPWSWSLPSVPRSLRSPPLRPWPPSPLPWSAPSLLGVGPLVLVRGLERPRHIRRYTEPPSPSQVPHRKN